MRPRKAAQELDPDALRKAVEARINSSASSWRRYTCKLVTPMVGGGVTAGVVDPEMPIRATAIRGQLRFWWRLLNRNRPDLLGAGGKPDSGKLFAAEREIWGGLGDDDLRTSRVLVRVESSSPPRREAVGKFVLKDDGSGYKGTLAWDDWARPYALFPSQGKVQGGVIVEKPRSLAREGLLWTVLLGFCDLPPNAVEREALTGGVLEAFRWWATFGGVGARTRRGCGALEIASSGHGPFSYVSESEVEQAGLELRLKPAEKSAMDAWKLGVDAMSLFRQGVNVGRGPRSPGSRSPAGRSWWPEADAIRRITNPSSTRHPPRHEAGDVFPRAPAGLPIIFHFKDGDDPADSELVPVVAGVVRDRMASPLIVRPYRASPGKWRPAVLKLPTDHVYAMGLELRNSGKTRSAALPKRIQPGTWWPVDETEKKAKAVMVQPLKCHGSDVLSAFMAYFAPPSIGDRKPSLEQASSAVKEEIWPKAQIRYDQRNGTVTATGPNNRAATAIQDKGREIWGRLSAVARRKISAGFFRAAAVVQGKDLLRVEEDK